MTCIIAETEDIAGWSLHIRLELRVGKEREGKLTVAQGGGRGAALLTRPGLHACPILLLSCEHISSSVESQYPLLGEPYPRLQVAVFRGSSRHMD